MSPKSGIVLIMKDTRAISRLLSTEMWIIRASEHDRTNMKCKMEGSTHIFQTTIAIALLTMLPAAFVGCTDDSVEMAQHDAGTMRFQVACASADDVVCKSGATCRRAAAPALPLQGGLTPMYLVPSESEVTDAEDISSAGIFSTNADKSGAGVMHNVEVTYDGNWIPKGSYSWPQDGSLHIVAYSPYCDAPGEDGIVFMPDGMEGNALPFDFSVASDISDQSDLLWAEPIDAHSSPCGLTFRHALTRLRFVAGAELPPLTISKIEIKNVYSKGKINIATGEWSDLESLSDFTIEPDLDLAAQEGSAYVEPGTSLITDDDDDADEFFMLPQDLGAESKILITIDKDGETIELEANAGGTVWREGKTVTYKLSTNPAKEGLQFDIEGNFSTPFTGGVVNFNIVSTYNDKGKSNPVEWVAEFTDGSGNVTDTPDWISDFSSEGKGSGGYSYTAEVRSPVFNVISPQSQVLQNAQDINDLSGHNPYNLANAKGAVEVENTANTYIVNAPGCYSLPLVYGNAVKNGMSNPASYTSEAGDGCILKNFINHRGDPITDPYIYNNSGCVPTDAGLVWEDRIGLISDVKLTSDGKSLMFEVPKDFIRQGNALLAVRDRNGEVLWSWQIWVTDYNPEKSNVKVKTASGVRQMYSKSIGAVRGGDDLTFPEGDAYVRFRQVNVPSGMEPLSVTVKIHQEGLHNITVDYNTYYQWGRKDPIMGDKKRWFDRSHNEVNELSMKSADRNVPDGKTLVECMIGSPSQFWKSVPGHKYRYNNLWNSGSSDQSSVKTVYDPSPVGAKVPEGEFMRQLIKSCSLSWGTSGATSGFFVSGPEVDGELFFTALGYRRRQTGLEQAHGNIGEYWSAQAAPDMEDATCLSFNRKNCGSISTGDGDYRGRALAVRPVKE